MNIELDVTIPQALTLQAMFEYMNRLSGWGGSRIVGFYADGDGNFHPKATFAFSESVPELTDEMRTKASTELKNVDYFSDGDRMFDFDAIAWMLHDKED